MKPSEQLRAGKALIATPETWTQGEWARNTQLHKVNVYSPKAVCWCSIGAALKVDISEDALHHLRIAAGELVWMFNDRHTHAEVMEMWDRAIALAEKDESR